MRVVTDINTKETGEGDDHKRDRRTVRGGT